MRSIFDGLKALSRSRTAGVCVALLCVLTICLCATVASAAPPVKPAVVVSQTTWLATFQGGGALASGNAAGSTMAVNSNGDILISTTYGNLVLLINGQTGASSTVANWSGYNVGPITIDAQDNLYVGGLYTNNIIKIPYVNGAYVAAPVPNLSGTPPTPAKCTGTDTAECNFGSNLTNAGNGYYFGVVSMQFDPAGDFFFALTNANHAPNSIWECTAACIKTGTPASKLLYQEPTALSVGTTGQLMVGGMALDPWGNLFFTDSAYNSGGNESFSSNLNELTLTGGVYAAKPTVLYSETDTNPGAYDDELDGVAVDGNGTVYLADQYSGVYAFPNNAGVVDTKDVYGVATQGLKLLTLDSKGNLYGGSYANALGQTGDALGRITVNNLWAPKTPMGTPSTAKVSILINDGGCEYLPNGVVDGPAVTIAAVEDGKATPEFAGVTTGGCFGQPGGGAYNATVTFTPSAVGERSAVLWATDTVNGGSGWATASGWGSGALANLDPGVWTSYWNGFTEPYSVAVDAGGNLFVADAGAGSVFKISAGKMWPKTVVSGLSSPYAAAIDAGGNLWVADSGNNQVDEIETPNLAQAKPRGNHRPGIESATFGGTGLSFPAALAFGPDGVLYIVDLGNGRVVTYNPSNGLTAVRATGLSHPWGIAVDSAGAMYVTDTGHGQTLVYWGDGSVTTLKPAGVTVPWGVAVDPSGSVLISDKATGNIVRVPNVGGTLNEADATIVETNPHSALGIALDAWGNLYTVDKDGAAVYAIMRTGGAINFGTVKDGSSDTGFIWFESAGDLALDTPAESKVAAPFSLVKAAANDCSGTAFKTSIASGTSCELAAKFSPTGVATAGIDTGTLTLTSKNGGAATVSLTGTAETAGTTAQTITFTAASPVTYGVAPITLSAKASSGLAVKLAVTGPATLSGVKLTIKAAGTVVVTATQNGNATYSAATPVSQTIVVKPATITVTATNVKQAYGVAIPTTFAYTIKGILTADKPLLTGTPVVTTTATAGALPGTYPINVAQGTLALPATNYNYLFNFVNGTLTITALAAPATPTISPKAGPVALNTVVTISDTTAGVAIYYTTDGTTPSSSSTLYTSAGIKILKGETIKAVATLKGHTDSAVATAKYTIKP